jgi:hypothetical protein
MFSATKDTSNPSLHRRQSNHSLVMQMLSLHMQALKFANQQQWQNQIQWGDAGTNQS